MPAYRGIYIGEFPAVAGITHKLTGIINAPFTDDLGQVGVDWYGAPLGEYMSTSSGNFTVPLANAWNTFTTTLTAPPGATAGRAWTGIETSFSDDCFVAAVYVVAT